MSNLTLIIGNKNYSTWSLRPWFLLQHYALDFTEKRIPLFTETTEQQLEPYNSDFKVPVLQDGDITVWDTLAIMEYVSENYLNGKGWPEDKKTRALARSISAEMHSSFSHIRNELPMNCRKQFDHIKLSSEGEREAARIKQLWRLCRTEHGQSGPWLFGDFSIADAMYAPIALRFSGYNVPLSGIEQEYVETILNHTAIQTWIVAGKQEVEIIAEDEIDL